MIYFYLKTINIITLTLTGQLKTPSLQNMYIFIGLPLEGIFDDSNNRGFQLALQKHQIDAWGFNPNKQCEQIPFNVQYSEFR